MTGHDKIITDNNKKALDDMQKHSDSLFLEQLSKSFSFMSKYGSSLTKENIGDTFNTQIEDAKSIYAQMFFKDNAIGKRASFCIVDEFERIRDLSIPMELTDRSRIELDSWLYSETIEPYFIPVMNGAEVDDAIFKINEQLKKGLPIATLAGVGIQHHHEPEIKTICIDSLTHLDSIMDRGIHIGRNCKSEMGAVLLGVLAERMINEQIKFACSLTPRAQEVADEFLIHELSVPELENQPKLFRDRKSKDKYQFGKYVKRKNRY